jgi:hypothetical protein
MEKTTPDRLVARIDDDWALAADSLQWILQRRRAGGSSKDILARCMREKGVPPDAAAVVLAGLPNTFRQWRHGYLTGSQP